MIMKLQTSKKNLVDIKKSIKDKNILMAIFEIVKSKDSIEKKIKEFIKKVEFVIKEIKNLEIKNLVYGDKEKIINELEEILTNKDKFFKNSLGI